MATTLPIAIVICSVYSVFGHSCFQKHNVFTAKFCPISDYKEIISNLQKCVYSYFLIKVYLI